MRFLLIIVCFLIAAPSMAHQLKSSVTTVLFNQRTHNIELMHRFYLHDTEHAVGNLFKGKVDIINNKCDQKRFAKYVESHVALQTLEGEPLTLNYVGAQVDGKQGRHVHGIQWMDLVEQVFGNSIVLFHKCHIRSTDLKTRAPESVYK